MDAFSRELSSPINSRAFVCPKQGRWSSFRLVDESGCGKPYAGLLYTAIDSEGLNYVGMLDDQGSGKVENHCAGPLVVKFVHEYAESDPLYTDLMKRDSYPLKISALQVRAEQTNYVNRDGARTERNAAQESADIFYQIDVGDLVEFCAHLPPVSERRFPVRAGPKKLMREYGRVGVTVEPFKHTVLEVRPLRALRPIFSGDAAFSAVNLYQLALMSTLVYCPFGQEPDDKPVTEQHVVFNAEPSLGGWFGNGLARFKEVWQVEGAQQQAYVPLYEDVSYSSRFEIVPFDPSHYAVNNPMLEKGQETPASVHFLDDRDTPNPTDTQVFITHSNEIIVIAARGTSELVADGLRDFNAHQVPFNEGVGRAHEGFYNAALVAYEFAIRYLDRFRVAQKIIICGHSLGGAIAFLLAEMLRRRDGQTYDIQLYTYGAPRAGDSVLVEGAADLVHHRIVNNNDLVPSVPFPWVDLELEKIKEGFKTHPIHAYIGMQKIISGLVNDDGDPYSHHGTLRHFMPVRFSAQERSAILWTPGCKTITDQALCTKALDENEGLPERGLPTLLDHFMLSDYIPACWATLRRHQQALENQRPLITRRERKTVAAALESIKSQLDSKRYMANSPDPYGRRHGVSVPVLEAEMQRIEGTLKRLDTLADEPVSALDVYGSCADQPPVLADALARWQAHAENARTVQLAMAPGLSAEEKRAEEFWRNEPRPTFDELMAMR